jgi:hypothetical protein
MADETTETTETTEEVEPKRSAALEKLREGLGLTEEEAAVMDKAVRRLVEDKRPFQFTIMAVMNPEEIGPEEASKAVVKAAEKLSEHGIQVIAAGVEPATEEAFNRMMGKIKTAGDAGQLKDIDMGDGEKVQMVVVEQDGEAPAKPDVPKLSIGSGGNYL